MEVGSIVITIVDKVTTEGLEEVHIPKGTAGRVCELYDNYALVEIWGDDAPPGVWGVYDYDFNEIKERHLFFEKKDNGRP